MAKLKLWWHLLWQFGQSGHRYWEVNYLGKPVREGGRWIKSYRCECGWPGAQ